MKDIIETKIQSELIFKPKINTKSVTRSTVNRDKSGGRREEDLINYGKLL